MCFCLFVCCFFFVCVVFCLCFCFVFLFLSTSQCTHTASSHSLPGFHRDSGWNDENISAPSRWSSAPLPERRCLPELRSCSWKSCWGCFGRRCSRCSRESGSEGERIQSVASLRLWELQWSSGPPPQLVPAGRKWKRRKEGLRYIRRSEADP